MRFDQGKHPLAAVALCVVVMSADAARAFNQTSDLSPVVIGGTLPFATQIQSSSWSGDTLPTLQSFARAEFNGQWLLIGGLTSGMHSLADGFLPEYQNTSVYVIDPNTQHVWSRSLASPSSGLTQDQIDSLSSTNAQFTQQGSHAYIVGGFGQSTTTGEYQTYSTLTSIDLPGLIGWTKGGAGVAADDIRQISDPLFQVTGGEMVSTSNGKMHLIFGQNYPSSYEPRQQGTYTEQVRTFTIADTPASLSVSNIIYHTPQDDFHRRDLNVVPIIQNQGGQLVQKVQALAGVFTPSFGTWTVPVTIDADGNATEPDPLATGTFKQGMNSYRAAHIELYSASTNTMHSLQLGGISYLYYDPASHATAEDPEIPYINDLTDIITDAAGHTTQYLLPASYPSIAAPTNSSPLLFGAEAEFFLKDGIATYSNGVIDLDALSGPTLIGYIFGGIAADAPNGGMTSASNELFPVIVTPVPEPTAIVTVLGLTALTALRRAHDLEIKRSEVHGGS
jgi:hypothetical protein